MKRILFLWVGLLLAGSLVAQEVREALLDSAVEKMTRNITEHPQEKIYIQTDKPYYVSGERIWFRTHLVNACLHLPAFGSRYVYVELINPLDSVMARLKVRPEKDSYYGDITLPEILPEGYYKLRAYTNYMRNEGEDYFSTRYIRIGAPQSAFVETQTEFELDGKSVYTTIRFTDLKNKVPLVPKELIIKLNGEPLKTMKANEDNLFAFKFGLSPEAKLRVLQLELDYEGSTYRKFISVPFPENNFDVGFFPEGGYMQDGVPGRVAFKALQSDGSPINIKGNVYDNENKLVMKIASFHAGMGVFSLIPESGKSYYAICQNEKGDSLRFELPSSKKNTAVIKTNWVGDRLWISVSADNNLKTDSLYLIAHIRGQAIYSQKWDSSQQKIMFDAEGLPSGVMHIVLLNSRLVPVSERLVFVYNKDEASVKFETDKTDYSKRSLVKANIRVSDPADPENFPLEANVAVSVTDNKDVEPDSTSTILTYLLLTSDLRGHIENPAYYFQKNKNAQFALDVLMMTQGWRRYNPDSLFSEILPKPIYPFEKSMQVSGTIRGGILSKLSGNASAMLFSVKTGFNETVTTDRDGRFVFRNFELPDSILYAVKSFSEKGKSNVDVSVDEETFPGVTPRAFYSLQPDNKKDLFHDFIYKADQKYTYENGFRMIHLDQVVVSAPEKKKYKSTYYTNANSSLTTEQIEKFKPHTMANLLMLLPGVFVSQKGGGLSISIRGQGTPLFLLDDVETDIEVIEMLTVDDIGQVDLLKDIGYAAFFGQKGANGVISIMTKTGTLNSVKHRRYDHFALITPLGYHQPAEFYSPKYDTPEALKAEEPDLRTTLYWNPAVVTDTTGAGSFEFYSADASTTYSVIIQGVSKDGKIIYYRGKIDRTKE